MNVQTPTDCRFIQAKEDTGMSTVAEETALAPMREHGELTVGAVASVGRR